jgi:hypothetical protein
MSVARKVGTPWYLDLVALDRQFDYDPSVSNDRFRHLNAPAGST